MELISKTTAVLDRRYSPLHRNSPGSQSRLTLALRCPNSRALTGLILVLLLALAGVAQATVTSIAWWRMGEGEPGVGNSVSVASVTNQTGGPPLVMQHLPAFSSMVALRAASRVGSAYSVQFFPTTYGTNAVVSTLTNNFGLELWVYAENDTSTNCLAYNGNTTANGWGLYQYGTNFQARFGGVGFVGAAVAIPLNWVHLALVRDNGVAKLYVNGVAAGAPVTNAPLVPTGRLAVAARPETLTDDGLFGRLDEVRVFTFAPGGFVTNDLLYFNGYPPTATTAAASPVGNSTATLLGTVNPGGFATSTWFEWGTTTNYGNYSVTNTLAATNAALSVSTNLTGLVPGVTYYYRVGASNVAGVVRGANVSFTTATFSNVPIASLPGTTDGTVSWADYDNDGRLDFMLFGYSGASFYCQLWRNTGSTFTNVPLPGVPAIWLGNVAWGDYDNDGRLDFLLTGEDGASATPISSLWRNTGAGFSNVTASVAPGLPGFKWSTAAWGDYDNDGRLDFLVSGFTGTNYRAQLWRNTGAGFTNVPLPGLSGTADGSVAWADYDGDGWLDFFICGTTNGDTSGGISQLWQNTGNGFSNVTASAFPGNTLQAYSFGTAAWGDFDNDGRPDLLVSGYNVLQSAPQLLRNTGSGFTNVTASLAPGLPGVFNSTVAWGDYDNDGRLDFLLTGQAGGANICQVWRNTGAGFVLIPALPAPGSPGVQFGAAAWGDFDNDGRLDFLMAGSTNNLHGGGNGITRLWRNLTANTNSPPTQPTGLAMTRTTNAAMLSWSAATDEQTPSSGLSYNVRAGTTPGGTNLLAAHVNAATGFRRLPAPGNAQLRQSLPLAGLTNGQPVYWSVQAVDNSFAGGPFASETSVVSTPTLAIAKSSSTNATVSWTPPTFGWSLQERTLLTLGNWSNSISGGLNPVSVSTTNAAKLYRLKTQ